MLLQQQDGFGEAAATLDFVYFPLLPHPSIYPVYGQALLCRGPSILALLGWVSSGKRLSLSDLQCLQLSNEHPFPSLRLVQARNGTYVGGPKGLAPQAWAGSVSRTQSQAGRKPGEAP